MRTVVRVTIDPDYDVKNPCDDYSPWQLYSFSSRHVRFLHPDKVEGRFPKLKQLLRRGLAFWLGYYEHGDCQWALSGEQWPCQWDSVNRAGLLVWEEAPENMGAKTLKARREDARGFLKVYTDWSNGRCFVYDIEKFVTADDFDGSLDDILSARRLGLGDVFTHEEIDSCGGYIGYEHMVREIRDSIVRAGLQDAELVLAGKCSEGIDRTLFMSEKEAVLA